MSPQSYLSPKLEVRAHPDKGGLGIFARVPIPKDELLLVWGGEIFTYEQYLKVPEQRRPHFIQVEENLYLGSPDHPEPADYINHSCSPTAGLSGQIALVALRDIAPDEEICFDYATSDGSPYDEFTCACGAPECRGWVSGDDWQLLELQEKYASHFSPYLQRRIDQMRNNDQLNS